MIETFKCEQCNNSFSKEVKQKRTRKIKFCSTDCHRLSKGSEKRTCKFCHNSFIVTNWRLKRNEGIFCNKECERSYRRKDMIEEGGCFIEGKWHIPVICAFCKNKFLKDKIRAVKFPLSFCNHSCSTKYLHKHKKLKLNIRSKSEDMLVNLIKEDFPNLIIILNDREVLDGLEIDILIPEMNLAIELNGPTHYFPIYGQEKLDKIINKDVRKQVIIQQKGINLIIIDTSHQNTKKRIETIINTSYKEIIKPILNNNNQLVI